MKLRYVLLPGIVVLVLSILTLVPLSDTLAQKTSPAQTPPEITNGGSTIAGSHCSDLVFSFTASDADGDVYWFEQISGPGITSSDGTWIMSPTITDVGEAVVEVRACDESGCGEPGQLFVTITNQAPAFESGCGVIIIAAPGDEVSHLLTAMDFDECDSPTFFIASVTGSPVGPYVLDPISGIFSFSPEFSEVGTYQFFIGATDNADYTICSFTVIVGDQGTLSFIGIAQVYSPEEITVPPTPWGRLDVNLGEFALYYPEGTYFLNMYTDAGWMIGNMTIFLGRDGPRISKYFDLGVVAGVPVTSLPAYIEVSTSIQYSFSPGTMALYDVSPTQIHAGGIGGGDDYFVPEDDPPAPQTEPNPDSTFKYWTLPVDSTNQNVQAHTNQCIPAGVANSIQFLAEEYGELFKPIYPNEPGLNGDSTLVGKLGECMKYDSTKGVYLDSMLFGKLNCLDEWGLGDALVHRSQGTGFLPGESTLPDSLYDNGLVHDDSHNGKVTFEWLYRQIKRGENIELSISYPDTLTATNGSDSIVQRGHMVRMYGAGSVGGQLRIRILDDGLQSSNDPAMDSGLQYLEVNLEHDADSNLLFDPGWSNNKKCTINFALSESPKEHYAPPDNAHPWHNEDGADNREAEGAGDANGLNGTQWRPLDEPGQGLARWGGYIPLREGPIFTPMPPPPIRRPVRRDPRTPTPIFPPWEIPERITLTLVIEDVARGDTIFLDHLGVNPYAKPLAQVVPSFWHEVVPDRGMEWEVEDWDDNDGDGFLSVGDRIAGTRETLAKGWIGFDYIVPWITMDIWFIEFGDTLPTFTYTCDWYKDLYVDLSNYSVPDFDQKQLSWFDVELDWDRCGPAATANALWWIDSKLEPSPVDPHPFVFVPPNDGYPLVAAYGPWDDHDSSNVQPLINDLSSHMTTGVGVKGTLLDSLINGTRNYIDAAGLAGEFSDTLYHFPYVHHIVDELLQDNNVVLRLMIYEFITATDQWVPVGAHYVTVAGYCSEATQICISDPWLDYFEGEPPAGSKHGPTVHNDADSISGPHGQIQHDPYSVWTRVLPGVSSDPVSLLDYPIGYDELQNFEGMNTAVWNSHQNGRVVMVINEAFVIREDDGGCCTPPTRGNVDGLIGPGGPIDVSDLTFLVAYLFTGGPEPSCLDEGNVDGIDGPAGPIDVSDLTYLVAYLFTGGPPPPPCP